MRIGVFVCHCGSNIEGTVDTATVAKASLDFPEVVYATDTMYACSEPGQDGIIQAIKDKNLTGVVVERPTITETTALGAAYLAGLAVGFWESEEQLSALWQLDRRFEPNMPEDRRAELLHQWHRAVQRAMKWIEEE